MNKTVSNPVSNQPAAFILASEAYRLKTIPIRQDALCIVLAGTKTIHLPDGKEVSIKPHQCILLTRNTQWDITNHPNQQGKYEAIFVNFDEALVNEFQQVPALNHAKKVKLLQKLPCTDELLETAKRILQTKKLDTVSPALLRHRLFELLLLIAQAGYRFSTVEKSNWINTIHQLVTSAPSQDWSGPTLAKALNLSESSLRRRLRENHTTIAITVRDIRLEHALHLLQTTRLKIGEVAYACGWRSHSQFSGAFLKRWGTVPSSIRANLAENG